MTQSQVTGVVWILVEQSAREASFEGVRRRLVERGVDVHVVTMSELVGSGIRDALSGGAERVLRGIRVVMRGRNQDEDLVGAVKRAKPDVLAVTTPRHLRALGLLESVSGIESLQVGIFPDYDFDAAWDEAPVQAFIVPHASFQDRLVGNGVVRERVLVAGPAVQDAFSSELDRDAVRAELGLKSTVVLCRAETLDPHALEKLVFQATLVSGDTQFIFHHNSDQTVATALRRAASQYGLKAAMFGKVNDLERYVLAADVVVASPTDPYIPEILAVDRPLMLVGSGSGDPQVDFLTSVGAARHVSDVLRLSTELDRMLESAALADLTAAATELSPPNGSEQVAEAILTALDNRVQWRAAPAVAPSDVPKDAPADDTPSGGAFEVIGDSGPAKQKDEPNFTGISRAEAKDQLAALIMMERSVEKKIADVQKQQERWRSRLEMAREWGESDLATEAESTLRGFLDESDRLETERRSILRQKNKLKEAALGGSSNVGGADVGGEKAADMEKRFRQMEVNSDLDDLKDRIRRELGD